LIYERDLLYITYSKALFYGNKAVKKPCWLV